MANVQDMREYAILVYNRGCFFGVHRTSIDFHASSIEEMMVTQNLLCWRAIISFRIALPVPNLLPMPG